MAAKKRTKVKARKKKKAPRSALRAPRGKKKVRKVKKAAAPKIIGKVSHYYDKIGVGIIELKGALAMGDTVTIERGEQKFKQLVSSMQINHEAVERAGRGDVIGLKVKKPVREGALVLKG